MALQYIGRTPPLKPATVPGQAQRTEMTSIDDDLKSMALGIQAWFDGSSEFTDLHKNHKPRTRRQKPTKQPTRRK